MTNDNYTASRAEVATVDFGFVSLEGLMAQDGSFAISIPQVSELFQFPNKHASRDIKLLLGKDFQFPKWTSQLHPKAVNVISLLTLEELIIELTSRGNLVAKELARACVGLSLQQRYCDAFGVKFEVDERNNWIERRRKGIESRITFTGETKAWLDNPINKATVNMCKFIYASCSDCINKAVTGHPAKDLMVIRNCKKHEVRNTFTVKELDLVDKIEDLAAKIIKKTNKYPLDAVKEAIALHIF